MKKKRVTYILIAINILVFALMSMTGGSENSSVLIRFGAMNRGLVINGEWWRVFLPIFIHIGTVHLLMNCYSLYILGGVFENLYGSAKFTIIYLLSGIMGNLFTFAFGSIYSISAGASTSLYGLFGLAIALFVFYQKEENIKRFGASFMGIIAINILYSFTNPSIGILGHLGGLVGGFILGGILPIRNRRINAKIKMLMTIIFIALIVFLVYAGVNLLWV